LRLALSPRRSHIALGIPHYVPFLGAYIDVLEVCTPPFSLLAYRLRLRSSFFGMLEHPAVRDLSLPFYSWDKPGCGLLSFGGTYGPPSPHLPRSVSDLKTFPVTEPHVFRTNNLFRYGGHEVRYLQLEQPSRSHPSRELSFSFIFFNFITMAPVQGLLLPPCLRFSAFGIFISFAQYGCLRLRFEG